MFCINTTTRNIRDHHQRKSSPSRSERKRALAIHTGKVTEREILEALKRQLPHGAIVIKNQKNIADAIQYAMEQIRYAAGDAFDKIFIISDVDNLKPETLKKQREDVSRIIDCPTVLLLSNPCIEVWLCCYTGTVSGASITIIGAQKEAKNKSLTCGSKNKSINSELLTRHNVACQTAERLRKRCGSSYDIIYDKPLTDFDQIINFFHEELHLSQP